MLTELLKMGHSPKYWRTRAKAEVDFVIDDDEVIPIEVKSHVDLRKVERSMRSFIRTYEPTRAYMVGLRGKYGEVGGATWCTPTYQDSGSTWGARISMGSSNSTTLKFAGYRTGERLLPLNYFFSG